MIGKTISHYRILEKLGEGGMGVVYRAEDTKLEREVALKFLSPRALGTEEEKTRFVHEAKAAAALNHPNICTVHEIEEAEGRAFIAMALIEGESLRDRIARGRLEASVAVDIAIQIGDGLVAAHRKGIVHRDIKPANIMVTPESRAKIMDFGLARMAGGPQLTKTGTTLGTIAYTSPEQARGESVDHRTDLWSLGVVLYEMLTGERPFKGDYDQAVVYSILNEEPERMSARHPGIPTALDRVVDRMLAKDPGSRYQTAGEIVADLRTHRERLESAARLPQPTASSLLPSIAVMPFADMSPDRDQEYFCDGMAEEIINALTQVAGLRVIARTSAFAFKGKSEDIREIGRKLDVSALLEGSVRKAGNRLRITAQLITVTDGSHLWSERYDREMEDVFAIQDEISLAVVDRLKVKLLGGRGAATVGRGTEHLEAYNLYLKGRYHWNKREPQEVRKGMQCFQQATEEDPNYAAAYAGLADCYLVLENLRELEPEGAFQEVDDAVTKALKLDDSLAEAHASLSWLKMVRDWDWEAGERELKRAIELNPGYATAHHWRSVYLMAMGRPHEMLAEARRAQELDPLSPMIGVLVGLMLNGVGDYDQAAEQLGKVLEIDPTFTYAHIGLSDVHLARGMYEEAFAEIEKVRSLPGGQTWHAGQLGYAYAVAGRRDDARKLASDLEIATEDATPPTTIIAAIYAALGENDRALALLEKLCETRSSQVLFMLSNRAFDGLHSHPRFVALLKRIGVRK